jgi:hypothetical protein
MRPRGQGESVKGLTVPVSHEKTRNLRTRCQADMQPTGCGRGHIPDIVAVASLTPKPL